MLLGKKKPMKLEHLIEYHLRLYHSYKVGLVNLQKQYDDILPGGNLTTKYELREGTIGAFVFYSDVEEAVFCRLQGKEALDLQEGIFQYKTIITSIDKAMEELTEDERKFIQLRYFKNKTIESIAQEMGYGNRTIVRIRKRLLKRLVISLRNLKDLRI